MGGGQAADGAAAPAAERSAPTRRVLLKCERVIVLPEDVELTAAAQKAIAAALGIQTTSALAGVDAWVKVGEAEGSKQQAIESYAGKPGTAEAKPGTYKAPSASSWARGRRYDRPLQPKVEASDID